MIGPLDPDSLDPAVLRQGADLLERIALRKRQQAEIIELSIVTQALTTRDADGLRGIDRLVQLDPIKALQLFKTIYRRITMLALQITVRD
jgi:hypothetical protein